MHGDNNRINLNPRENVMIGDSQLRWTSLCLCACIFAFRVSAIEYVFPAASGVIDITKAPYNADRTGQTDVSAILTKAANDIIGVVGWGPATLYLPNGTYLVKNTFAWSLNSHGNGIGPHLTGQSRSGTVIKLAKGTWPLGTEGKPVIQTGAGDENNFDKGIYNLTVLVDSNNAGAIGIVYVSDNHGMMSDVDVISADGKGMYGIQSAGNYTGSTVGGNGPFIIRRTFIKGFQVGFRGCASEGEMMSQIRLSGQSKYGLWASCGDLIVDSLTTNDTCIAVEAEAPVMLTNAVLSGGSPTAYAIRNFVTSSFFRDIKTTGYKFAISSVGTNRPPLVSAFGEYTPVPTTSLFSTATRSMNIPPRYPPVIPWESDFGKWAFPDNYKTGGRTDVQALQAAIDDPTKTTVCLVRSRVYQIDAPVYVRGTITRIFAAGGMYHAVNSSARLAFSDGSAPVVTIEKVSMDNVGVGGSINLPLFKNSSRTLVVEGGGFDCRIVGGGETYLTDQTSKYLIDNAQARVYMWQWEANYYDSGMVVRNGMVRSVGQYMEGDASVFVCTGGFTEILGSWYYSFCANKSNLYMLLIGNNANVSAAGMFQQNFCSPWSGYTQLVKETRAGTTKTLTSSANPAGGNIALYTAYDSAQVAQVLQTPAVSPLSIIGNTIRLSVVRRTHDVEIQYRISRAGPVAIIAADVAGRIVAAATGCATAPGTQRAALPALPGVVCVTVRTPEGAAQRLVVQAR